MKRFTVFFMALAIIILSTQPIHAQPKTEEGYQPVIMQMTLFHPLGTNGKNVNVQNYTSINLIYGKAASLKGFEVSGFAGKLTDYGVGAQVAGFANVVENYFEGAQIAGFGNVVGGNMEGAQISGFGNISGSSVNGGQIAGFGNITGASVSGIQIAGFGNITGGSTEGFQLAGFGNITGGSTNGVQIAGFGNIAGGIADGVQIAGFSNISESFTGFQLAPVNMIGSGKGLQVGIVNFADTLDGVPFGVVSWVKNGYRKIDVYGNESFYLNAAFKTGVRNFYNIIGIGYRPGNFSRYGLTWGFGSEISLGKGAFMNIEATATQVGEDEVWTNKLNLLNQLKFNFGAILTPGLGIYGGPSLNVMVSEYQNPAGNIGSGIVPSWTFYDKTSGNTNVAIWPGISVGLRIL